MKKNYKLFFALCAMSVSLLKAQAPTPDLLHYKFNGTGSLVTNYASAPPAGTATGTIMGTQTQTGAIMCMGALVGNGLSSTNEYVNTGWAPNLGSAAWTLSFWTQNIIQTTTTYYILGDVNSGGFRVFTGGVAGSGNWIIRGGFTDVLLTGAATTTPSMASFVYSPTFSTIVGYINGVPTTTVSQSSVNFTGAGPFKVGGYSSSNSLNAGGQLTDFRIYSTDLSSTDIMNIYNETSALLVITATPSVDVCPGETAQLSATGANTYTWDNGASTASISVTPSASVVYTVTGFAGTCTASATSSVNVMTAPTVAVNDGTICAGDSFTINPTGAATYTIEGGNAIVNPSVNSTYSVVGTGTNGCVSAAVNSSVTVNNLPVVTAASSTTLLCAGQTATLTASGASSYVWNTTATTAVIAVSPTTTTNYTVNGTDANNCSASYTISQAVSPCTGIEANSTSINGVFVYPNPTNGEFFVVLHNTSPSEVSVTDVSGRVIFTKTASNETELKISLQDSANGIYFVNVKSISGTEVFKIVKY